MERTPLRVSCATASETWHVKTTHGVAEFAAGAIPGSQPWEPPGPLLAANRAGAIPVVPLPLQAREAVARGNDDDNVEAAQADAVDEAGGHFEH